MLTLSKCNNDRGISLIEILVVIFIISIALVNLLGVAAFSLRFSSLVKETVQANTLAQEAMETTRNFRDGKTWSINGLGTLSVDTAYHPTKIGTSVLSWDLALGEENIDSFKRKIVFSKVFRDTNDNISQSGIEDSGTRKVTVTVSWNERKVELVSYLTNWK